MKVTCRVNNLTKESGAINFKKDNFSFINNKVEKIGLFKAIKVEKINK